MPRRIGRLTGTRRQSLQVASIHTHAVNLLRTGAAGREHDIGSGLRIHFWLDFYGARRRDGPKPRPVQIRGENPATPSRTRGRCVDNLLSVGRKRAGLIDRRGLIVIAQIRSSDSLLARLLWRSTKRWAETPSRPNSRRKSGNTFPYPRTMRR